MYIQLAKFFEFSESFILGFLNIVKYFNMPYIDFILYLYILYSSRSLMLQICLDMPTIS